MSTHAKKTDTHAPTNAVVRTLAGNEALAEAMRQINPDVVAAYPITPSSHIVEVFSEFVADGKVQTEFVATESEHSAMSACVGAAASGVRAMTATASQGLALMHEVLVNAAGLRLPIVLLNGNRALSAPLSIHGDHSDSMQELQSGWIQLYAKSPQEAYDLAIQAFPIAEDLNVRTPVMVCFDAFDVTHMVTNIALLHDADVTTFIGEPQQVNPLLDFAKPVSYGTYTNPGFYFEHRRSQHEGMENARTAITAVGKTFGELTSRDYSAHIETYEIDDAETVIVIVGSLVGVVEEAVRKLRAEGQKVGFVRVRTFRPFPAAEIAKALKNAKHVAILDRTLPSGGVGGPLFNEVNSALLTFTPPDRGGVAANAATGGALPHTANFIYGLGQREFFASHAIDIFHAMQTGKYETVNFVNVRE